MNKKILAAAIAASVAAPMAVAADVTVYGVMKLSVDSVDMGKGTGANTADSISINDQDSRLGFKGSEDLGNGLKAIFQIETALTTSGQGAPNGSTKVSNNTNEFGATGSSFATRNTFVGLAGDFGTVLVGQHDHPVKMQTGSLDYFADTQADYNRPYSGGLTDLRAEGAIAYVSPDFSGFKAIGAVVPGENNIADGIADAYSVAGIYSNGGLHISVGYEEGDKALDARTRLTTPTSAPVNGTASTYEQTRVGLGYTMDAFSVSAVWANVQTDGYNVTNSTTYTRNTAADTEVDTWVLAGKYTMGNNAIKAKWFDNDVKGANNDVDGWAIGLEHKFSKRTQAQVVYLSSDAEAANATYTDGDIFSVQMNHSF